MAKRIKNPIAGGIYQTRQMVEDKFAELDNRLTKMELALPIGGG